MSLLPEFTRLRPAGGFQLIMADPPWHFSLRSASGEAKSAQAQYGTMDLAAIKSLPVQALAADHCLLWLWATNPMLIEALGVLHAWGFTFKTQGVWVKRTKNGRDAFGTGYLLRSSSEPFLLGTVGAPTTTRAQRSTVPSYCGEGADGDLLDLGSSSITIEAVAREHSRKPDEAFAAAEGLMPEAQRLELFSRQSRPGWATWGNEAGKFDAA